MGNFLEREIGPYLLKYLKILSTYEPFIKAVEDLKSMTDTLEGMQFDHVPEQQWVEFFDEFFIPRKYLVFIERIKIFLESAVRYGIWEKFDLHDLRDVKDGETRNLNLEIKQPSLVITINDSISENDFRKIYKAAEKSLGTKLLTDNKLKAKSALKQKWRELGRMFDVYRLRKVEKEKFVDMLPELQKKWKQPRLSEDNLIHYFHTLDGVLRKL